MMQDSRSTFLNWLRSDSWHMTELLDWCALGSGRGRNEVVPSDFIRGCLSSTPDSAILSGQLAQRIAQTLNQQPDLKFNHINSESAGEQMLDICTFLNRPELLSDAVWSVLNASTSDLPRFTRAKLLQALIFCPAIQGNEEAKSLWFSLLNERPHPIVGGSPDHGMNGLSLMRPADLSHDLPDFEACGKGLAIIAEYYARISPTTKWVNFVRRLGAFSALWGLDDGMMLVDMAHKSNWMSRDRDLKWAVRSLPCGFEHVETPEKCRIVVCQESFTKLGALLSAIKVGELCDGQFVQLNLADKDAGILADYLMEIENRRSNYLLQDATEHDWEEGLKQWIERESESLQEAQSRDELLSYIKMRLHRKRSAMYA